jgi:predicted histone-like DNA-binding protein
MSLKYHVVERRDLSKDAAPDATLFYGQIRKGDSIPFDKICAKISLFSTATKGDVQNVIAGLLEVLKEHLEMGQSVNLGEMGHFRMIAGSHGADTKENFNASMFKKGRIKFYPGAVLREVQNNVSFDKLQFPEQEDCDRPHS